MMNKSRGMFFTGIASVLILLTSSSFSQEIENGHFRLKFDRKTGFISVNRLTGSPVFSGCVNSVNVNRAIYLSDAANYRFSVRLTAGTDKNPVMVIEGTDKNKALDFEKKVTLKGRSIQLEVIYRNVSGKSINIGSVDPMRLVRDRSGMLYFRNASECLTNGAMYYDAGVVQNLDSLYVKPHPYGEMKGGIMQDTVLEKSGRTVESWWNISLFSDYFREAMSIGYLYNRNSLGRLQILKEAPGELSLVVESVFNKGFDLLPGRSISSDKCALVMGNDPYSTLEAYADMMVEENPTSEMKIVNGWCNWFYTMNLYDENEILANAKYAADNFSKYGLEYIQIDEGYQTHHGDWQGNNRFPHGLKWMNDSIKSIGLKPGVWISPFVISEESHVFKDHPGWLLKDRKGNPVRIGPWPDENTDWYRNEVPRRYCLDITVPEAGKWFADLIDTLVNNWGFEMIKIDFVAWTVFSAVQFHDKSATPAQVYLNAMRTMRRVAGDKCVILDCGPGNITTGLINSMRIEYDQNYGTRKEAWVQYFGNSSSSAGAAAKRYYFHNKLWINDIDHVCIDLLPLNNSQAVATLIGLSGGNTISGDRLMNLEISKKEVLKKIFPSTPENARPVDLLESEPQTCFSCRINRKFGSWDLLAFFNPDQEKPVKRHFSFERVWLDTARTYICFDFWSQRLIGEVRKSIDATVGPGSVVLYSLHEKTGYPQVISTTRHVKQGAVEIEDTGFDPGSMTLSGTSMSPQGSAHSVYVYVPEGFKWVHTGGILLDYEKGYTVRMADDNLLRIDLNFDPADKIMWKIKFEK